MGAKSKAKLDFEAAGRAVDAASPEAECDECTCGEITAKGRRWVRDMEGVDPETLANPGEREALYLLRAIVKREAKAVIR